MTNDDLNPIVAKAIQKLTTDKIELDEYLQEAIKKLWWARFGCEEAAPTTIDYEMELNDLVYCALDDWCAENKDVYDKQAVKEIRDALQKYEDFLD